MNIRHYHKKVSLIIFLPLALVVVTGLFLQMRNKLEWLQPQTVVGQVKTGMVLTYEQILVKLNLKETEIEQVIYRPVKRNVAIRLLSGEEIQIDPVSGDILKRAIRRTNIFIELHQGSFFSTYAQYGVFFVSGLGLLFLIISGVILLFPRRRRNV